MGWREKMGSGSLARNTINPKKEPDQAFFSISSINSKGNENEKGHPIPMDEKEFAQDERQAIIDVDGGHQDIPYSGPVEVKMESVILGATDVILEPDHATVGSVKYSLDEIRDLIGRGISAADLREVHRIKQEFDGAVVPSKEVEKLEPIARW